MRINLFIIFIFLLPIRVFAIPNYEKNKPPTDQTFVDTLLFFSYDRFQFSETMFTKSQTERAKIIYQTHPEFALQMQKNKGGVDPSFQALERPPTILLFENSELKGTPYVVIDSQGVKIEGKVACAWHEGNYNPLTPSGAGTLLRFCPKDLPILSYDGSLESEIVWIRLGLILDSFSNGNFTTTYKKKKLYGHLPDSVSWYYNKSPKELEDSKIKEFFSISKVKTFFKKITKCIESDDFKCLIPLTPTPTNNLYPRRTFRKVDGKILTDGALSIFSQGGKAPYLICPNGKSMFLTQEEFAKCIFMNKNLKNEMKTCLSRPAKYGDVEFAFRKSYQNLKEFKQKIKEPNVFEGIVMHGNYFDCVVYLFNGDLFIGDFEPNYKKIEKLVLENKIKIVGPSQWPFQDTSNN